MRGVTLLAINNITYSHWAVNMAISIRFHSPSMPINIVVDEVCKSELNSFHRSLFDKIIDIEQNDMFDKYGNFSPGKAKLSIYKYCEFDENIFLDGDGLLIKPIEGLFDCATKDVHLQVVGRYQEDDLDWKCIWMKWDDLKLLLPEKFTIFETNTSFLYFKKGEIALKFFEQSLSNFTNDSPTHLWGRAYPDELAFNLATAQLDLDPCYGTEYEKKINNIFPICFDTKNKNIDVLETECYLIGCFGGKMSRFKSLYDLYDMLIKKYCKEKYNFQNQYKSHQLMAQKHVQLKVKLKKRA